MIRIFPVSADGGPHFVDDFGVVGRTGKPHAGIDLFAAEGTPIVAVDDGDVRFAEDPLGGHAFYLVAGDGTVYYGAHLSAYEGIAPRAVTAGQVIGYVGRTGNAATTSPHLHFEVHPHGGPAVDPYLELAALVPVSVQASEVAVPPLPANYPPLPPPPAPPEPSGRTVAFGGRFVAVVAVGALLFGLTRARGPRRFARAA